MLIDKYSYPKLKRIQHAGTRKYTDGDSSRAVPSVTTILSDTGDKTALIAWRKRVGEAEATRISTESAGLGTLVHNSLEKYILGEDHVISGTNLVHQTASSMSKIMIDKGFSNISELWGTEVGLIAQGLYAGTSDAIGVHDGDPAIIDFKTAKKIKKREWIEDYFLQGCAYALAHNEMFETNIKKVVILMVDREGGYAEFVIEDAEFDHYATKWAMRVTEYYSKK
jgi:ATP-dependent exoDNAse (exonuclease V) beta subunit